jgi:hypothetical protein
VTDVTTVWGRRLWAALVACAVAALVAAPPALADPAGEADAALRSGNLYVAPDLPSVRIDSAVAAALPSDLKVAVLPAKAGLAITLAGQIEQALGADRAHPLTIGVFTVGGPGQVTLRAASSKYCPGVADAQAQAVASADDAQLANAELGRAIRDFVQRLSRARVDRGECSSTDAGAAETAAGAVWGWTVAVVVVAGAAIGALVLYGRRKQRQAPQAADDQIADNEFASVLSSGPFADGDAQYDGDGSGGGEHDGGGELTR